MAFPSKRMAFFMSNHTACTTCPRKPVTVERHCTASAHLWAVSQATAAFRSLDLSHVSLTGIIPEVWDSLLQLLEIETIFPKSSKDWDERQHVANLPMGYYRQLQHSAVSRNGANHERPNADEKYR